MVMVKKRMLMGPSMKEIGKTIFDTHFPKKLNFTIHRQENIL